MEVVFTKLEGTHRHMASWEEDLDEGGPFLTSSKVGRTHLKKGTLAQKR